MPVSIQPQKFYIIAHNPNTIADVTAFLDAGANALEPDICVSAGKPGKYFVSHDHLAGSNPFTPEHSLVTYLTHLRRLLTAKGNKWNLALIMFDYKDPVDGDINELMKIIHENFGKFPICSGVAIGVTVGKIADAGTLVWYDHNIANAAIGIDEEKIVADVASLFETASQPSFSYANGIIKTGIKPGVFKSMLDAKFQQSKSPGLKLVYTWILELESSLIDFLELHIDGIIVNLDTVQKLKTILASPEFGRQYVLAHNGYNPWTAPLPPTYTATIFTRDAHLAGTDVPVSFTLIGTLGSLKSKVNGAHKGVFEDGAIDHVVFPGANIGTITGMQVNLLDHDGDSDWLPKRIDLTNNVAAPPSFFNFGPEEWVVFGHPVTKPATLLPVI